MPGLTLRHGRTVTYPQTLRSEADSRRAAVWSPATRSIGAVLVDNLVGSDRCMAAAAVLSGGLFV